MKKLLLQISVVTLALQPLFAQAETCSAMNTQANTNLTHSSQALSSYNEAFNGIWTQYCQTFRTVDACNKITRLIAADPYNKDFSDAYSPLLSEAIKKGQMNSREANAFHGLVVTLRGLHYGAKIAKDEAAKLVVLMNKQSCAQVGELVAMSDTALVSASSKGKSGICKVTAKGSTFKIKVGAEDFPIAGYSYSSIPETAKALREALDAGSCFAAKP